MMQENLLKVPQGDFLLHRLPQRRRELLRAWDAADELILDHIANEIILPRHSKILIVNDNFGALTTALNHFNPVSWSDSYLSHQATRNNLQTNNLTLENISFLTSLETPPDHYDLILIKIPKTLALLEDQLIKLQPGISSETKIIAGGMIKGLTPNIWTLFERIIGPTTTSLARKKARLIFITPDNQIDRINNPYPVKYILENTEYEITNHANVFSRDSLDIGTRFFLQHLPQEPITGNIIDLGCGNGILGIMAQKLHPAASLHFIDESYMAIASAKENYRLVHGSAHTAYFHIGDGLAQFKEKSAHLILCNPPFHQHNAISDHIATDMFKQSKRVLCKDGELWVIGNRHLKYHLNLKKIFSNYSVVATNSKFIIYRSLI